VGHPFPSRKRRAYQSRVQRRDCVANPSARELLNSRYALGLKCTQKQKTRERDYPSAGPSSGPRNKLGRGREPSEIVKDGEAEKRTILRVHGRNSRNTTIQAKKKRFHADEKGTPWKGPKTWCGPKGESPQRRENRKREYFEHAVRSPRGESRKLKEIRGRPCSKGESLSPPRNTPLKDAKKCLRAVVISLKKR